MARRRDRLRWASMRSRTQRCRLSLSLVSIPRRAMRSLMQRAQHSTRQRRRSYALSAWSVSGWRRGIEHRGNHRAVVSVAPLRRRASGVPSRSTTRWRFVPVLPRSVGFGPVSAPPFAATEALSRQARLQSRQSALAKRSSNTRCRCVRTPAVCQSHRRRGRMRLLMSVILGFAMGCGAANARQGPFELELGLWASSKSACQYADNRGEATERFGADVFLEIERKVYPDSEACCSNSTPYVSPTKMKSRMLRWSSI